MWSATTLGGWSLVSTFLFLNAGSAGGDPPSNNVEPNTPQPSAVPMDSRRYASFRRETTMLFQRLTLRTPLAPSTWN